MINKTFQKFIDEILNGLSIKDKEPLEEIILKNFRNYTALSDPIVYDQIFLFASNFSLKRNLTETNKYEYDKLLTDSFLNLTMAEFNSISGRSFFETVLKFVNCNSLTKDVFGSCGETLLRALSYKVYYDQDVGLNFLCFSSAMSVAKILNKSIQVFGYKAPSEIMMNLCCGPTSQPEIQRLVDMKFFLILNHAIYTLSLYSAILIKDSLQEKPLENDNKNANIELSKEHKLLEICYASSVSVIFLLLAKYSIDRIPDVVNEQNISRRFIDSVSTSIANVFRNRLNLGDRIFSRRLNSIVIENQGSGIALINSQDSTQFVDEQNNQLRLNFHTSPIAQEPNFSVVNIDITNLPRLYENNLNNSGDDFANRQSSRSDQSQVSNFATNNANPETPPRIARVRSRSENDIMNMRNVSVRSLRSGLQDNQRLI